jgi:hypothetical protein
MCLLCMKRIKIALLPDSTGLSRKSQADHRTRTPPFAGLVAALFATMIKRTKKKRVVEVTGKMTLGTLAQASHLLQASRGGKMLNTAFIEWFKGTMRPRLATLARKCRPAAHWLEALEAGMYLIGCTWLKNPFWLLLVFCYSIISFLVCLVSLKLSLLRRV